MAADPATAPAGAPAAIGDLSIGTVAVARHRHARYEPAPALTDTAYLVPLAGAASRATGIPVAALRLLVPDRGPDVSALALTALGGDARDEPLYYVRSGPQRDAVASPLSGLVHRLDWAGDDLGITHLEELGGTLVLDLVAWTLESGSAAVLICDEPAFTGTSPGTFPGTSPGDGDGRPVPAAVALRLRRGSGPLQVLDCGEGAPAGAADSAGHLFTGRGPCDAWLAAHRALAAGQVTAGDTLLLHTKGPRREGWLTLRATDPARLRLTDATPAARPSPSEGQP
ncbi:hypothetical protein [Streptomyces aidingensis]|uniref:Uncharacterized protein n=1 Tax=Streptomyces aidingensis TaxID=910347 RepID=A0A1I1MTG2_9ACTN|nr:hypothetical protein [Streptomyces aidingensis]SFC88425.1 hypothetical protein SAMN05421773_10744 [Streptomyces aidingensis]